MHTHNKVLSCNWTFADWPTAKSDKSCRNFVFLFKNLANCKRNADTIVQESYKLVLTCMISCKLATMQDIYSTQSYTCMQESYKNLARIMQDLLQEFCKIHKDILHALLHTFIVAMETTSSTRLLSLNLVINSTRK